MTVTKQRLVEVPVLELIPYASNPRKNDQAVTALAASLAEYGYVKTSIGIDEANVLLYGHTTLKAIRQLGWETVPQVDRICGLTPTQKKKYRIADNKFSELSEWDAEILALEFQEIKELGGDWAEMGFELDEIEGLLQLEGEGAEEDDYEPPPEIETDIQAGDMYQLGSHRLLCGDAGWQMKQCIIWIKNHFVMGRQDYHWQHEPILYGWRPGAHQFFGGRTLTTTWHFDRPQTSKEHPTMKPVALVGHAIQNSSKGEDIVLDPFLGAGSTLIACEQLGRVCCGVELDPKYCPVTIDRWEEYTGNKAVKIDQ